MPEHESYQVVISKRAAQQLVEHAAFMALLDEKLAHKLEKYRKLIFDKCHILLYQIKGQVVYVEYVIDGRQDYQWLLTK